MPDDKRRPGSGTRLSRCGNRPGMCDWWMGRADSGTLGGVLGIPRNLEQGATMFATAVRTLEDFLQKEFTTTLSTSLK